MFKKFNKKGFTLVELLATIAVLALVVGIVTYAAIGIINKAKNNSYKVTINNIEKNVNSYIKERGLFYISKDDNIEYQCITIENLIDYGYLNNNIIDTAKVDENNNTVAKNDYIYIERDANTKTVTKTKYMKNNGTNDECENAMKALGDIRLNSEPSFDTWSKSKKITITYKINNLNDSRNINEYSYDYKYIIDENTVNNKTDNFKKTEIKEIIEVTENGKLEGNIYNTQSEQIAYKDKVIDKIDTERPVIALTNTDSKTARQMIIVPIKVTDSKSGVKSNSFTIDDLIVRIGNNEPTKINLSKGTCNTGNKECIYDLKVEDNIHEGALTITIERDKVFDKAENGNDETVLDTNITFSNTYNISYALTGGSISSANPATYSFQTADITLNNPTKTGYSFAGWTEQIVNLEWYKGFVNYTTGQIEESAEYPNSYYSELISLKAGMTYTISGIGDYDTSKMRWRAYDANGKYLGSKSANNRLTPDSDYYVRIVYYINPTSDQMTGTVITAKVTNLTWTKGFLNYDTGAIENSSKYPDSYYSNLFHVKQGMTYIISGIGNYNTRRIRWRAYDASGKYLGSKSDNNTLTPDSDYYVRLLYYINPSNAQMTGTVVNINSTVIPTGSRGNRRYTAIWNPNKIHIKYNMNDGTWAGSANTYLSASDGWIKYDTNDNVDDFIYNETLNISNYNNSNYINITKTGYSGASGQEWCTGTSGNGICYNQATDYTNAGTDETASTHFCDARNGDCTVSLYVNWQANTYTITYNANGGSGAPSATSYTYAPSGTINLSSTKPTRSSYNFLGWSTSSTATTASYTAGQAWNRSNTNNYTLYAVWKLAELKCCAKACSGSYNCKEIGGSKAVWKDNKCWLTYTDRTTCPTYWTTNSAQCIYVTGSGGGGSSKPSSGGGGGGSGGGGNTGGGTCFVAGTKVMTPYGLKNIEELKVGDFIYSYDEEKANIVIDKVAKNFSYITNDNIYTVYTENSSTSVTENHPFYVKGKGYTKVKDLTEGDILLNNLGHSIPITKISINKNIKGVRVYNLNVYSNHNYFAGLDSVLVHNKVCFLPGTKVMTTMGYKDIEKIRFGDMVLTYNEETKMNEYQPVLKLWKANTNHEDLYIHTLFLDDNTNIKATANHKFYIKRNNTTSWIEAENIQVGDYVKYANDEYHKVTNNIYEIRDDVVYTLLVEKTHNFYVGENQILVHNAIQIKQEPGAS